MNKTARMIVFGILTLTLMLALSLSASHPSSSKPVLAQEGGILAEVKARGYLNCGVNSSVPGFGALDPNTGEIKGFDVDFCKAYTAAVFGEVTDQNLKLIPLSAQERFTAIQTKQVDVLSRNATWTLQRDTELGLNFGPVTFYDGQGLMVKADIGAQSLDDLDGASICTLTGTTTELNITEAMEKRGLSYELVPLESGDQTLGAFEEGRCDVLTSDRSQLAGLRSAAQDPGSMVILPDVISKEPLAPAYLEGDDQWKNIIMWTVFATVQAEEFGITQANVDTFLTTEDPAIRRFLGLGEDNPSGSLLGLDNSFVVNVLHAVGNYGEIYNRHLGPDTLIDIPRTINDLWTNGGLIYAPAWR
jgi:general L-amino acid transport system substrate-binding protein